jgi:hypothetical protein
MIEDSKRSGGNGMSRRLFLASAAGAAASVSFLSNAVAQVMAPSPRILKYSDHEPLGGMRTRFLKDVLFPAIERESNGRLKIEDHWDGEIAAA